MALPNGKPLRRGHTNHCGVGRNSLHHQPSRLDRHPDNLAAGRLEGFAHRWLAGVFRCSERVVHSVASARKGNPSRFRAGLGSLTAVSLIQVFTEGVRKREPLHNCSGHVSEVCTVSRRINSRHRQCTRARKPIKQLRVPRPSQCNVNRGFSFWFPTSEEFCGPGRKLHSVQPLGSGYVAIAVTLLLTLAREDGLAGPRMGGLARASCVTTIQLSSIRAKRWIDESRCVLSRRRSRWGSLDGQRRWTVPV